MLQKCVYTCEYIDDWEKFNEKPLPEKENFYSHLNRKMLLMQITGMEKDFEIKHLGEYHDLNLMLKIIKTI